MCSAVAAAATTEGPGSRPTPRAGSRGRQFLVEATRDRCRSRTRPTSTRARETDLQRTAGGVASAAQPYCPSDGCRVRGETVPPVHRKTTAVRALRTRVRHPSTRRIERAHTDAAGHAAVGEGRVPRHAQLVRRCAGRSTCGRVASVYAPGLPPRDFHLVVETALEGRLAGVGRDTARAEAALVRIATGRDDADRRVRHGTAAAPADVAGDHGHSGRQPAFDDHELVRSSERNAMT